MYFNLILLWITIFNIFNYVNTLRLSTLFVPSELIVPSETTWLNCTYDLENDHLYAIQWYKIIDGKAEEFYRYMPEQWPSVTIYEMPGVYIDEKLSKSGNVFLNKTDLNTEGIYRCEVSADSPSFQTVRKEAEMRVFQLPQIGPIIKQPAIDNQFKNHHQLLICTALNSKPQTQLSWFINGYSLSEFEEHGAKLISIGTKLDLLTNSIKPTNEINNLNSNINHFNLNNYNQLENNLNDNHLNENNEFLTINNEQSKNGLSNSTSQLLLELNLILNRLQFLNSLINNQNKPVNQIKRLDNKINQLMITCKGQITNHLEQSTELRIIDTNTDQLLTVKDLNEEGPIISGLQNQYNRRLDQLQLNCTSTKSKSAAELIWLLNERPALEYKNTLVKHFRPIKLTDTEIVWRSSLSVGFDDQLFLNSNSNNVRRLKYDRKQLKIKCKTILDKTIDVGNAVHIIELNNLFENSNEISKLPARHNRSANIIWPIFTGEIVIGLFIVIMVICVIRSVCKQ